MDNKDTYIDPDTGKKYNLKDFDDTRSWSKAKDDKGFYTHMKRKSEGMEYSNGDGEDCMYPNEELKETR